MKRDKIIDMDDEEKLEEILNNSNLTEELSKTCKNIYQMRTIIKCKYLYNMSREETCAYMYNEKPEYGYICLKTYNNKLSKALKKIKMN